jgi:hypothetical protein
VTMPSTARPTAANQNFFILCLLPLASDRAVATVDNMCSCAIPSLNSNRFDAAMMCPKNNNRFFNYDWKMASDTFGSSLLTN